MRSLSTQLDDISKALTSGTYQPGAWQKLLNHLEREDGAVKQQVATRLSAVSNQLHARHGYYSLPVVPAMAGEFILCLLGLYLVAQPDSWQRIPGLILLILTLQPTLKIIAGLSVGIRYSYAYLWYIEPRFKMAYGTYMTCSPARRVVFQLVGSIGTPTAFLIGAAGFSDIMMLKMGCWLGFTVTAILQVGAFAASWLGVKRVGPFLLWQLTTPAMLARELQKMFAKQDLSTDAGHTG